MSEQPRGRKFGPKMATHPSVGLVCRACGVPFREGDYTALVPLGPGANEEAQKAAREGRWYNATCVEVHWACCTGEVDTRRKDRT